MRIKQTKRTRMIAALLEEFEFLSDASVSELSRRLGCSREKAEEVLSRAVLQISSELVS